MSFQAMTWAVKQKTQSAGAKLVLLMLADHSNGHTGQCNPSHKRLAEECEMSLSALKVHIKNLERLGLLEIIHKSQDGVSLPNQYRLNLEGVGQNLAGGGSESDRGVGQNLATNQEDKPGSEPYTASPSYLPTRSRDKVGLEDFIKSEKEQDRKFFHEDLRAWMTKTETPDDILAVHWYWFRNEFAAGRKYKDWRATFRKSVIEVWGKLFAIDSSGTYYLTTAGKQIQAMKDKDQ